MNKSLIKDEVRFLWSQRAVIRTVFLITSHCLQQGLCWVSQFIPSGVAGCKRLGCLCLRHSHSWVLGTGAHGAARQALPVCSRSIWHSGGRITTSGSVTELWLCLGGSWRMRSPFTHSQDFHGRSFLSKCFLKQCKMLPQENVPLILPAFISRHTGQHLIMKQKMWTQLLLQSSWSFSH